MASYLLKSDCRIKFSDFRGNYCIECITESGVCPKKKGLRGTFGADCLRDSPPPKDKWEKPFVEWMDEELKEQAIILHKAIVEIECFTVSDILNYHRVLEELTRRDIRFVYVSKLEFTG